MTYVRPHTQLSGCMNEGAPSYHTPLQRYAPSFATGCKPFQLYSICILAVCVCVCVCVCDAGVGDLPATRPGLLLTDLGPAGELNHIFTTI